MKRILIGVLALGAAAAAAGLAFAAGEIKVVAQKGRDFSLKSVELRAGDQIRFTNEDGFLHQLFIHAPNLTFDSNEQGPGEVVEVAFPKAGDYTVLCGIHPKMKLAVRVD